MLYSIFQMTAYASTIGPRTVQQIATNSACTVAATVAEASLVQPRSDRPPFLEIRLSNTTVLDGSCPNIELGVIRQHPMDYRAIETLAGAQVVVMLASVPNSQEYRVSGGWLGLFREHQGIAHDASMQPVAELPCGAPRVVVLPERRRPTQQDGNGVDDPSYHRLVAPNIRFAEQPTTLGMPWARFEQQIRACFTTRGGR